MGKSEQVKTRVTDGLMVKVADNGGVVVSYGEWYHVTGVPTTTYETKAVGEGQHQRWQDVRTTGVRNRYRKVERTEVFRSAKDASERLQVLSAQITVPAVEMTYEAFCVMTMENQERD